MKEGLYVHVDEIKNVLDTFGSKSGHEGDQVTIIDEDWVLGELKERSEFYVTPSGNLFRRTK